MASNSVTLKSGILYTGIVMTSNAASQTFAIREEETGTTITGVWAAAFAAGLSGLRAAYVPPVNSRVHFAVNRGKAYAVGASGAGVLPVAAPRSKTVLGNKADGFDDDVIHKVADAETPNLAHNPPVDILEGELDLTNLMGVGIALLTGLAKLQAGDLAKVEVCLLNDMVRIVSQTFKHFNALGEYEIYNDGRLNLRWTGTSYDHESWGQKKLQDEKSAAADGEIDLGDVDKMEDTLRARFSHFVGFLGDFINTYVTDPGQALGDIAEDKRSGKFRAHVGNDGTLLVQSVAEIAFERVVRIPVPIEKRRHDDPAGNKPSDFSSLDLTPLKKWQFDPNPANMWHAAFQLRHYARWLSSVYSLARYRQLDKDWTVPSEANTPIPKWTAAEEDRESANPGGVDYYETYATIRIMRDGSIVNMDGYGSATVMAGGNVHVSAAKHLTLEAAGDINIVAGQDINLKARRSVEIAAVRGGLKLKARTWLHNFCEWGSVWTRSGALDARRVDTGPGAPTAPTPEDADNDPEPLVLAHAVLTQATEGTVCTEAINGHRVIVRRRNIEAEDVNAEIYSDGDITARAKESLELIGTKKLKIKSNKILATANTWLNAVTGVFAVGKGFQVSRNGSRVDVQRLAGSLISAPTLMARRRPGGNPLHENHVGTIPEDDEGYVGVEADVTEAADYKLELAPITPLSGNGATKPGFGGDYTPELVETCTQQKLRLESNAEYATWVWASDRLKDRETDASKSTPWPGPAKEIQFNGGAPLTTASASTTFDNVAPTPQKAGKLFRFLKR